VTEDVSGTASDSGDETDQHTAAARRDRLVWKHSNHRSEALPANDLRPFRADIVTRHGRSIGPEKNGEESGAPYVGMNGNRRPSKERTL